jgi:hypothetical protein
MAVNSTAVFPSPPASPGTKEPTAADMAIGLASPSATTPEEEIAHGAGDDVRFALLLQLRFNLDQRLCCCLLDYIRESSV